MKELSMKTVSNEMAVEGIAIGIGSVRLERGKPYAHLNDGYAYGGRFLQGRIFADRCIYLDKQHFQGEGRRCSLD